MTSVVWKPSFAPAEDPRGLPEAENTSCECLNYMFKLLNIQTVSLIHLFRVGLLLLGMQFIEGAGRYFFCSTEIHRNEPFHAPPQGREGLGHENEGLCVLHVQARCCAKPGHLGVRTVSSS